MIIGSPRKRKNVSLTDSNTNHDDTVLSDIFLREEFEVHLCNFGCGYPRNGNHLVAMYIESLAEACIPSQVSNAGSNLFETVMKDNGISYLDPREGPSVEASFPGLFSPLDPVEPGVGT